MSKLAFDLFYSQLFEIRFLLLGVSQRHPIRIAGDRRMTDEILIDLKKVDELATQIVLGGIPVKVFTEASTNWNEERVVV